MDTAVCHPDDISYLHISSRWLRWSWFLIRMSYDNVTMSSGSHTLPFLSHPDKITNFDFSQNTVVLQRFRKWVIRYFTHVNENDTHTFCNTCFQQKMFQFVSDFHLDLFLIVRSTISQHEHCLMSTFPIAVIHMMGTWRLSKHMKIHNGSQPYWTFWLHAVPNSYLNTNKYFPLVSHFWCMFFFKTNKPNPSDWYQSDRDSSVGLRLTRYLSGIRFVAVKGCCLRLCQFWADISWAMGAM